MRYKWKFNKLKIIFIFKCNFFFEKPVENNSFYYITLYWFLHKIFEYNIKKMYNHPGDNDMNYLYWNDLKLRTIILLKMIGP